MYYDCLLHNQVKNNGTPISKGTTTIFKGVHIFLWLTFINSLLLCVGVYFLYSWLLFDVFSFTIDNFFLIILNKPLFLCSFITTVILGFLLRKHRVIKTFFTIKMIDSKNCLIILTDKKYVGVEYYLEIDNIVNIRYYQKKGYYELYCKNLNIVKNKNSSIMDCLLVCSGNDFKEFILDLRDNYGVIINVT